MTMRIEVDDVCFTVACEGCGHTLKAELKRAESRTGTDKYVLRVKPCKICCPDDDEMKPFLSFYEELTTLFQEGRTTDDFFAELTKLIEKTDPLYRKLRESVKTVHCFRNEKLRAKEEIFKDAIDTWGIKSQIDRCVEEMAELIAELIKYDRKDNRFDIHKTRQEIADVIITVSQMIFIFDIKEIEPVFRWKIDALEAKLKEAKSGGSNNGS